MSTPEAAARLLASWGVRGEGERMTTRLGRLIAPVRTMPRVFLFEDAIYGSLVERRLEDARRIVPLPDPQGGALASHDEVVAAERTARALRLRYLYDDPFKVWDGVRMFSFLVHRLAADAAILDFGSGPHSNVLRWLELYGFRQLKAVDVIFSRSIRRGAIEYSGDDVHRTHFPDGSFDAAIAQSVLEHGVNTGRFFDEARRVLAPRGYLLISTDFWPEKVDTGDARMYGSAWTIFSEDEIRRVFQDAETAGFRLAGDVDLRVGKPLLDVLGKRYTFLFFGLQRET